MLQDSALRPTFVTAPTIAVNDGLTAGPMATLGNYFDFEKIIGSFLATLPK